MQVAQELSWSLAHSAWHQGWYDDAGDVSPACHKINIRNIICTVKITASNPEHSAFLFS
jgi:hypothetical protein